MIEGVPLWMANGTAPTERRRPRRGDSHLKLPPKRAGGNPNILGDQDGSGTQAPPRTSPAQKDHAFPISALLVSLQAMMLDGVLQAPGLGLARFPSRQRRPRRDGRPKKPACSARSRPRICSDATAPGSGGPPEQSRTPQDINNGSAIECRRCASVGTWRGEDARHLSHSKAP
jgi:hypothetical protein